MNSKSHRNTLVVVGLIIQTFVAVVKGYSASWDTTFASDYPSPINPEFGSVPTAIVASQNLDAEVFVAHRVSRGVTEYHSITYIHRWHWKKGWDWQGDQPIGIVYGTVLAMARYGNDLYVAGQFLQTSDFYQTQFVQANSVAKLNLSGSLQWSALGTGVDGRVNTIAVDSSSGGNPWVYVGGSFLSPWNNVARWDGTQWYDLNGGVEANYWIPQVVNSIVVLKTGNYHDVYVAGSLIRPVTTGAGQGFNIAKWSQSDDHWRGFGYGISHLVMDNFCNPYGEAADAMVSGMTVHTNGSTRTIRILGNYSMAGYDYYGCDFGGGCLSGISLGAATLNHDQSSLAKWARLFPMPGGSYYPEYPGVFMGKVTSHSTGLYVSSGSLSSIMPFDCDPIAPPLTGQDLILRQDGNGDWQNLPSGGFSGACGDLVSNARGVFLIGTFGPRRYIP